MNVWLVMGFSDDGGCDNYDVKAIYMSEALAREHIDRTGSGYVCEDVVLSELMADVAAIDVVSARAERAKKDRECRKVYLAEREKQDSDEGD